MGVHQLFEPAPVRAFLAIRHLPPDDRPCHVYREGGITLLTVDPRHTRFEITKWNVEHLSSAEVTAFRAGFGLPPLGSDAPGWIVDDRPCLLYVPPALRLTGAPPLQGGATLIRNRAVHRLLADEMALYAQEVNAAPRRA